MPGADSLMLSLEGKEYKGEKEVLKQIMLLCKCEPHEEIISDIMKLKSGDVKKYPQKIFEVKKDKNIKHCHKS